MVTITDTASDALRDVLETSNVPGGQGVRLVMQGPGQLGLVIDGPREGDQVVENEGRTVFLIDDTLSAALDGATVDCKLLDDGSRQITIGMDAQAA